MTEYTVAPQAPLLPQSVAAAVLAVDGVHALHAGAFGEVATYGPGEAISGVRLGTDYGEVHIVTVLREDIQEIGERVRSIVERLTGLPIEVTIEDVVAER